jgi:hypothetical protein
VLWKCNLGPNINGRTNATHTWKRYIRIIYGLIQYKGRWHSRWNSEIHNLYKNLNIVDNIKIRRPGWVGHSIRMEDDRIPKMVLNGKFCNTTQVVKPRTRWEDVVQRDISQILGIGGWRRAEDTEETSSEGRPEPRRGCSTIDGMEMKVE